MRKLLAGLCAAVLISLIVLCAAAEEAETRTVRIIATGDLHGKFAPWNYLLNASSPSGSMAQLATAISEYRTKDALLVDAGDTFQDNLADLFIGDADVHPMVRALNALKYDVWVTGNHDYDYGLGTLKKIIQDLKCKTLTGNVYDADGEPIADGSAILERNGVRVALIGMVTPNIARWDASKLAGCAVTDPLEETRKIIDALQGRYDVLVGVFHMGLENEYGMPDSGVTDVLNGCPEFDVMVSSHQHQLIPNMEINGALVVQNRPQAQTMVVIDLTLERDGTSWKVVDKTSQSVNIAGYEADPDLLELLKDYDLRARREANQAIGRLEGGALAPESESGGIPAKMLQDTALIDLINAVQLYYSGAKVAAAPLTEADANLYPGEIRRSDIQQIYRFSNTLYKLRMTGAQLKKYMEWSASYFNTFRPGDTTISVSGSISAYDYFMFAGVCYEVDLTREPGSRIRHLTWPDGTPVGDDATFDLAVNNYCANSQLLVPGVIYDDADDLPALVEMDVHSEIGSIHDLITNYIVSVKNGRLLPECDNNWRLIIEPGAD